MCENDVEGGGGGTKGGGGGGGGGGKEEGRQGGDSPDYKHTLTQTHGHTRTCMCAHN